MGYISDEENNIHLLIEEILNDRDANFNWQCPVSSTENDIQEPSIPKEKEYICNLIKNIKEKCDILQNNILNAPIDDQHYFTMELLEVDNHLKSINDYASMLNDVKNNIGANLPCGNEVTKILTGDILL
jgi:hypothetical protein